MEETRDRFTPEEKAAGNALFKEPVSFVLSVANLSQLPLSELEEIAFAGRSNVGKSSLINALFNQKKLAKTSSTPGRTQQLNYFNLNNKLYLVDLPGYGYAEAPEKTVSRWQKLIFDYLRGRVNLSRIFLLIDSRHGLKKNDLEIMETLDKAAVTYQLILTKIDKISTSEYQIRQQNLLAEIKKHAAAYPEIIAVSSLKNRGLDQLRAEIASLI